MQWNLAGIGRVGFVLVLLAGSALAGPLPTDPNALSLWQGSKVITSTKITATVEYAVYAPGQFSASAALNNPSDPSLGSDYVYAYEIIAGTQAVKDLTIGITAGGVPAASTNIGDTAITGGISPTSSVFILQTSPPPTKVSNAKFTNIGTTLWQNNHSDILYFTSPFAPQLFISSISGGSTAIATNQLPSPIPEPSTAILAATGFVAMLLVRRLRKS
ncbi:MAG TPA: hypothetical protein VL175_20625 [Pirellulales bacterium]|jgi:hypothetical protein|nr:hypothetical protein [Pirellulales bacterium]